MKIEDKKDLFRQLNFSMRVGQAPTEGKLESCRNITFFANKYSVEEIKEAFIEWVDQNNINLFIVSPLQNEISNRALWVKFGNITFSSIAPTAEQIDKLNLENTVLFIDEPENMKDKQYRRSILEIVNGNSPIRVVADETEKFKYKELNNLLFAIMILDKKYGSYDSDTKNSFYDFIF